MTGREEIDDSDELLAGMERKKAMLQKNLEWLQDNGEDSPSARNEMIAHNQVIDELGHFNQPKEPSGYDSDRQYGLLVRTRMDAAVTKLNSSQLVDALAGLEQRTRRIELLAGLALGFSAATALLIWLKLS